MSGQSEGQELDIGNVTGSGADGGVRHGALLVAFTDADCGADPDWLRAMQDGMEDPATAILVLSQITGWSRGVWLIRGAPLPVE